MSSPLITIDFETRSEISIRDVGVSEYASHASTEVMCMAYAIGDGEVDLWIPGEAFPDELREAIEAGVDIEAHNAGFEIAIWSRICVRDHDFPEVELDRWYCSAAKAAVLGLPTSLDKLAAALRLGITKDKTGHRLMLKHTKPRKPTKDDKSKWYEDPLERYLIEFYCMRDVEVERAASKRMPELTPTERTLWLLDRKINTRGITVDRDLAANAVKIVSSVTDDLAEELESITGGAVTKPTQRLRIVEWMAAEGLEVESIAAAYVKEILADEATPPAIRRVLEIRQETAKSSTAKFQAILQRSQHDGRVRDTLRYHGAFTGRWAGSGIQIQNFPRGSVKDVDCLAECFLDGDRGMIELMYGYPIDAAKSALRPTLVASPGRSLLVWDYAQIEARVLAWLAGETWKLQAFRDYDAGTGPDLYRLAYAKSFNIPIDQVTDAHRQVGKVEELALGYQGGPGAFVTFQNIYGVRIGEELPKLAANFPRVYDRAVEAWHRRGVDSGIDHKSWVAAEIVKICWRQSHPATVQLWKSFAHAASYAVEENETVKTHGVTYSLEGDFLRCELPSGRSIFYYEPKIRDGKLTYRKTFQGRLLRIPTYGGKLAENVTQAIARDPLAEGMLRMDRAGVEILSTVHDEVVAEADDADAQEKFNTGRDALLVRSKWSRDIPLAVDGFITKRYRK